MSRKGNPYDNAFAESFIKTLKVEEVYLNEYETFEDAFRNIWHFIEKVYNRKRLHSALDYRSPVQFEEVVALYCLTICLLSGVQSRSMLTSPELHIFPSIVNEFLLRGTEQIENSRPLLVMNLYKSMSDRPAPAGCITQSYNSNWLPQSKWENPFRPTDISSRMTSSKCYILRRFKEIC